MTFKSHVSGVVITNTTVLKKENAARHLTSPVGVAAETDDYGGAFGRGASVLEGAAMPISAAKHTGKMPH